MLQQLWAFVMSVLYGADGVVVKSGNRLETVGADALGRTLLCFPVSGAVAVGSQVLSFYLPIDMRLDGDLLAIDLETPQATGALVTCVFRVDGVPITVTPLTIDNGEGSSLTATTPPALSTTGIYRGSHCTLDITQIGDGTAAGLKLWLIGYETTLPPPTPAAGGDLERLWARLATTPVPGDEVDRTSEEILQRGWMRW